MKTISRISGIGYLIIFITGFYANFAVVESLIDLADTDKTLENLSRYPDQLLHGILSFVIMILFDAVLVWTLYKLLQNVHKRISLIASSFRLINVIFFGVALSKLIIVYVLVAETESSQMSPEHIMKLVESFNEIWIIGLIFFGVHLTLLGYLIIKSSFVPNWLGFLLMMASAGYIIDGFANLYLPNYKAYQNIFMFIVVVPGVLGEFSFTLWLLFSRKLGIKHKSSTTYI